MLEGAQRRVEAAGAERGLREPSDHDRVENRFGAWTDREEEPDAIGPSIDGRDDGGLEPTDLPMHDGEPEGIAAEFE